MNYQNVGHFQQQTDYASHGISGLQQMACSNTLYDGWFSGGAMLGYNGPGLQNAFRSPAQRKLDRASVIAAEVRARRPEMQVKKLNVAP